MTIGDDMSRLMHSEASWYLTNTALVAIGVYLAVRRLPGRTRRDRLVIGASSLVGAVLLSLVISIIGGFSAVALAGLGISWLAALYLAGR